MSKTSIKTGTSSASDLHPNNPHRGRYDFDKLILSLPELARHTITNPNGQSTIDFSDAAAVIALNKALLKHHYGIKFWELPKGYLCPPIPSRADYIHHIAELLANNQAENQTQQTRVLDIGTGSSCIYPIIGSQSYHWYFTATDIDPVSVNAAKTICKLNPNLNKYIEIKLQTDATQIFAGVINTDDYFDMTMCNPPFHASLAEAAKANKRKRSKLQANKAKRNPEVSTSRKTSIRSNHLNFGGQKAELWTPGGERTFVSQMITESRQYGRQVGWFTTLISKADNLKPLMTRLNQVKATQVKIINMQHGQKLTRILAWRFD